MNIEVMWLIKKLRPDFKTIADFRKENREQLKKVFKEFIILCKEWDLIGRELIAVDGTKFRANNSKKNNYNEKKIKRKLGYIEEKIDKFLKQIEENYRDEKGDVKARYSVKEMEEKIKELQKRREAYKKLEEELRSGGNNEISTTDPDARMMDNKKNGVEVNYNVQIAVDEKNKLVVANRVTNRSSDQGHLNDMIQAAKENIGLGEKEKIEVVADGETAQRRGSPK